MSSTSYVQQGAGWKMHTSCGVEPSQAQELGALSDAQATLLIAACTPSHHNKRQFRVRAASQQSSSFHALLMHQHLYSHTCKQKVRHCQTRGYISTHHRSPVEPCPQIKEKQVPGSGLWLADGRRQGRCRHWRRLSQGCQQCRCCGRPLHVHASTQSACRHHYEPCRKREFVDTASRACTPAHSALQAPRSIS